MFVPSNKQTIARGYVETCTYAYAFLIHIFRAPRPSCRHQTEQNDGDAWSESGAPVATGWGFPSNSVGGDCPARGAAIGAGRGASAAATQRAGFASRISKGTLAKAGGKRRRTR